MFKAWYDLAMLSAESQQVIALRMGKLAFGGPAAHVEAQRMVSEKVDAATHSLTRLMAGATPESVVKGYRKRVRANVRRLSR